MSRTRRHIEDDHQAALITWARYVPLVLDGDRIYTANRTGLGGNHAAVVADYLIAIPNGGRRNPREAARMKGQGVRAGVSDLLLAVPRRGLAGLWIELKAPKGSPSAPQLAWIHDMRRVGYQAGVCYGVDEARQAIVSYLGLKIELPTRSAPAAHKLSPELSTALKRALRTD